MGANNFADATLVEIATDGGTYSESGVDNSAFDNQPGEQQPTGYTSGRSAWWKYTPTTGGSVTVHTGLTTGGNTDTEMGVWTGSAIGSLSLVASNSDSYPGGGNKSQVTFTASAGVTYRIQVAAYNNYSPMYYGLTVTGPATAGAAAAGFTGWGVPI